MNLSCLIAKFPVTDSPFGTLRVTTEPMLTLALSPIEIPLMMVQPGPIQTSSPILTLPAMHVHAAISIRFPSLSA